MPDTTDVQTLAAPSEIDDYIPHHSNQLAPLVLNIPDVLILIAVFLKSPADLFHFSIINQSSYYILLPNRVRSVSLPLDSIWSFSQLLQSRDLGGSCNAIDVCSNILIVEASFADWKLGVHTVVLECAF